MNTTLALLIPILITIKDLCPSFGINSKHRIESATKARLDQELIERVKAADLKITRIGSANGVIVASLSDYNTSQQIKVEDLPTNEGLRFDDELHDGGLKYVVNQLTKDGTFKKSPMHESDHDFVSQLPGGYVARGFVLHNTQQQAENARRIIAKDAAVLNMTQEVDFQGLCRYLDVEFNALEGDKQISLHFEWPRSDRRRRMLLATFTHEGKDVQYICVYEFQHDQWDTLDLALRSNGFSQKEFYHAPLANFGGYSYYSAQYTK